MKKGRKGTRGYIRREKIKRGLITALMFAIPLGMFAVAWHIYGTRKNVISIITVLGLLPAAKACVSWIMMMLQKESPDEVEAVTEELAKDLVHGYELVPTAYEGRMQLDSVVVCGNQMVCYSSTGDPSRFSFMEQHIGKILRANGFFDVNVRLFHDMKAYKGRLEQIAADPERYREGIAFKPDERYPDLSREELIFHTLMAISL